MSLIGLSKKLSELTFLNTKYLEISKHCYNFALSKEIKDITLTIK